MAIVPTIAAGRVTASPVPERVTFVASARSLPLDYLRVPYRLVEAARAEPTSAGSVPIGFSFLTVDDDGVRAPHLYWPRSEGEHLNHLVPARTELAGIPLVARVVDREHPGSLVARRVVRRPPRPMLPSQSGVTQDGSILLPFDPAEAIETLWSERYGATAGGGGLRAAAQFLYYRVRPILPRRVQIAMRRGYSRVQDRRESPRWPIEPALHDLLRSSTACSPRWRVGRCHGSAPGHVPTAGRLC